MPEGGAAPPSGPEARVVARRRTRPSAVWLVPLVAALVGVWVAVAKVRSEGPTITIVFDTAEGLEAGKTKVHYHGVVVGTAETVRLSDDSKRVVATVRMEPGTDAFLVEDTQFWVVRPRISGASITGLGTLISGAYIGMDIGSSRTQRRAFTALVTPPIVERTVPGHAFVLETATLGSLDRGTPIFFRRIQVGEVESYELDRDGQGLSVRVFVKAPYDRFVTADTRFWHASGIDMSLTASGLTVQTQSALAILIGGIAFETPEGGGSALQPAAADAVFTLYGDRAEAFAPARGKPQTYAIVLRQSVRGLVRGAPVEFRGIPVGEVADMRARFDPKTSDFSMLVVLHLYPAMFGIDDVIDPSAPDAVAQQRRRAEGLVAHGLRAQLRSGSLLTGSLYVALDFFPDAPPFTLDWSQQPVELAVVPGQLEAVEATLVNIVKKLDKLPIEQIGADVRKALVELDRTLASGRRTLDTADAAIAPDSALRGELAGALQEVSRAARAIRILGDYLERHPEALIRGKTEAK
jgi:paraquat-inducible protein B